MRESLRRLASDDAMAPRSCSGRVRVELLTGDHITIDVARKASGGDLLDAICDDLDILEKDYFGLLHVHRNDPRVWVDLKRRLSKTFRNEPWEVKMAVKFYPPEPSELNDEASRYQLGLAIRRDLIECGSSQLFDDHIRSARLIQHRAVPLQVITPDLEDKIDELYRKHKGQTPAQAELNYLENAKKLAMYGVELHSVKDSEDVEIELAVCAAGISVLRDGLVMNRFPWAKILKISYNKRTYTLRLRSSEFDEFETHVSFKLASTRSSKRLWRCSVEHHMFFRRATPVPVERVSGWPRLGARRVSCRRTLRQLREPTLCVK
nr:protein 4.1 homolog [Vanessa tameamea]